MKKVFDHDDALFFSSFWKHMRTNTLLLCNFTYFYVAKEDRKVNIFVNTPSFYSILLSCFQFWEIISDEHGMQHYIVKLKYYTLLTFL